MPDIAAIRAFLEPHHHQLIAAITAFAKEHIATLPPPSDDAKGREQARQIVELLGQDGWAGYAIPETWGGRATQPDLRACCLIREALAAASPLADEVFALQCLGSMPITLAGSPAQKERFLPGVVAGRLMAAFAMTEPDAGSDVMALATRARREGDGYLLNGRKSFISNAGLADFYTVFTVTDPESGHRGLTCFLVEADRPGLTFVAPQILSAPHPLGELAFEGCAVPSTNRLGEEGQGFKLGMATLDRLRATVAAAACGMAERALSEALTYATQRRQFGQPIAEMQLVQNKLARMATELTAARLLTYRAAYEADHGAERVTLESAMAKAYATEAAQRVIDDAVQIHGGRGVLAEHPVDRLYRAVRALRIYEGTTEIQRLVIARQLLKGLG